MRALLVALALLVSGCTQTGQVADQGSPPPSPEPPENLTPATDPCEGVACQPSTVICPSGSEASCQNSCSAGSCSSCVPTCPSQLSCLESWGCGPWGPCESGVQERACADVNRCGTTAARPPETRECEQPAGGVLFSEVLYDPAGTESRGEWIELQNTGAVPVQLAGWTISDNSGTWTFPDLALLPGDFLTVARDAEGFSSVAGCSPGTDTFTRGLNNNGDFLILKDPEGRVADLVAWEGGAGEYPAWEIEAEEGTSLQRIPGQDTDGPADWLPDQQPDPACG